MTAHIEPGFVEPARGAARARSPARAGAGVTLVELMVVVAIIGVIMTAAVVMVRADPTPRDLAYRATTLLREASRRAVAAGEVRADVALALATTARTRIVISGNPSSQVMTLELLVEDPAPSPNAVWQVVHTLAFAAPVEIYGIRSSAELIPGLGPETVVGNGTVAIDCYPNGSCDAATLYVHDKNHSTDRLRVAVMPLNGAPMVFGDW